MRSSQRKHVIDTDDEVPGEPLELSSLECWLLLLELYSLLVPMGFCNELLEGRAQMSYGMVEEVEEVVMAEGLFMFSSRLQMMCVMASWSVLCPAAALVAGLDVDGRLDASDCVKFANDVIV